MTLATVLNFLLGACLSSLSHSADICWVCVREPEGGRAGGSGRGLRTEQLQGGGERGGAEGELVTSAVRLAAPPPAPPVPPLLGLPQFLTSSSAPRPGGVLHSHLPLPHAGGPVDSRGDAAWGRPRNSVLPVPKPHASVGPPGKTQRWGRACALLGISAPGQPQASTLRGASPHISPSWVHSCQGTQGP